MNVIFLCTNKLMKNILVNQDEIKKLFTKKKIGDMAHLTFFIEYYLYTKQLSQNI